LGLSAGIPGAQIGFIRYLEGMFPSPPEFRWTLRRMHGLFWSHMPLKSLAPLLAMLLFLPCGCRKQESDSPVADTSRTVADTSRKGASPFPAPVPRRSCNGLLQGFRPGTPGHLLYRTVRAADVYKDTTRSDGWAYGYFCTLDSGTLVDVQLDERHNDEAQTWSHASESGSEGSTTLLNAYAGFLGAADERFSLCQMGSLCAFDETHNFDSERDLPMETRFFKQNQDWGQWLSVGFSGSTNRGNFRLFGSHLVPADRKAAIPGYELLREIPAYGADIDSGSDIMGFSCRGGFGHYALFPTSRGIRFTVSTGQDTYEVADVLAIRRTRPGQYRLTLRSELPFYCPPSEDTTVRTCTLTADLVVGQRRVTLVHPGPFIQQGDSLVRDEESKRFYVRPEAYASTKIIYAPYHPDKDLPEEVWNDPTGN
jgi:hypothetical protein